ncbi:phosphatase PAP2/dual specificity phosphatase family protein [Diaphorobacter aerolatus]|uniref:Phosphatase PAP2/dual specificity phosphatase family protein n=1 Tax=Diaphorobacter aerolatus TaxID=1288495 RepID=A0A7H0GPC4_9BURK|nr:phosphatase PAP2/dual specificity phosphatase family protein [Diaphorobacter aerolatus]QNP50140.1 phosphatase PAP2/dual specificity phosphatase family protein [Diaphorobacter aerolatus]
MPGDNELLKREPGTWKRGVLYLLCLAPFFFLTYGFANQHASGLSDVPSIVFEWEKQIPLWPWTIVPYWSIDLFYGLSLLLCWNRFELRQQALRLFAAQLISITCFVLIPLKFSFERPPLDGFFGLWFDVLMGFDKPFNQAPSLHIVLLIILWDFYRRHVSAGWVWLVHVWCLLIGVSVLTTWQHHFIDLPTGLLVGALCMWLFPLRAKSPFQGDGEQARTRRHMQIAGVYLLGALLLVAFAWAGGGAWLWLFYPAVSLVWVALAYGLVRPHFFQKRPEDGAVSVASRILFAPYFAGAWLNSRIWTRTHAQDSRVITVDGVTLWLGRIPSAGDVAAYDAMFDCAAELPLLLGTQFYARYLSLDLVPLQVKQLRVAARRLDAMLWSTGSKNVLVFCALGYSRSAAVLCGWLLHRGAAESPEAAMQIVRAARPWVVLRPEQIAQLRLMQAPTREVSR